MMKTLTIACLTGAAMMTAAVAGTPVSAKNAKAPVAPAPAPACAEGISYSNVSAAWEHTWIDGADDIDGVNLDLSYALIDRLYVRGTAAWADWGGNDWGFTAGLGYGLPLMKNLDLVAEAGGIFDEESSGFYVYPHLRTKVGCLELHAGAKYINIDDYEAWEAHVAAYYEVAPRVDLMVGGIFGEDASTLQVGARLKF